MRLSRSAKCYFLLKVEMIYLYFYGEREGILLKSRSGSGINDDLINDEWLCFETVCSSVSKLSRSVFPRKREYVNNDVEYVLC